MKPRIYRRHPLKMHLGRATIGNEIGLLVLHSFIKEARSAILCNIDPGLLFKIFSTLTPFHQIKTENNSILA